MTKVAIKFTFAISSTDEFLLENSSFGNTAIKKYGTKKLSKSKIE